jgi:rare lipoprotein A
MTSGLGAWRIWIALALAFAGSLASGMAWAGDEKIFSGAATYYSEDYKGVTASGTQYDPDKFTCAHPTLPFGTRLRVTDRNSHRSVVVVVTDRGPFNKDRMIDLSLAAAKVLQMTGRGVIAVTATIENAAEKAAAAATP